MTPRFKEIVEFVRAGGQLPDICIDMEIDALRYLAKEEITGVAKPVTTPLPQPEGKPRTTIHLNVAQRPLRRGR